LENQLIVYKPKLQVKKIILKVLLVIFISILIFAITAFCSAFIFTRIKWKETDYVDLRTTQMTTSFNIINIIKI